MSTTKSFDLRSFWFGCSMSSPQAVVQTPVTACTLDVTGFKVGQAGGICLHCLGRPPALTATLGFPETASFNFFGNGYVAAPLVQAVLPAGKFDQLERVVFTRRTVGIADQATEAVVVDDVDVTTH